MIVQKGIYDMFSGRLQNYGKTSTVCFSGRLWNNRKTLCFQVAYDTTERHCVFR